MVEGFRSARKSLKGFDEFAARSDYPALMLALRLAAVKLTAQPNDQASKDLIERAAKALDVAEPDLLALRRVPSDMIARGLWRPRSVNLDFTAIDATAKVEEAGFQQTLNRISHKVFPKTPRITVPGLDTAYRVLNTAVHEIDALGAIAARPLESLAAITQGWSDDLASDTQKMLRTLSRGLRPSRLSRRSLRKLAPESRREVLETAAWLSGLFADSETLVRLSRSGKLDQDESSSMIQQAARHLSSGLFGVATLLDSTARTVRGATDLKNWDTFSIHYLLIGLAKQHLGMVPGGVASGGGVTFMFPTLEQVRREGRAELRLVPNLWFGECVAGGLTLSSRGSEIRQRLVCASAQIAEYEHHVTAGIPNILSMDFGEDYAYGPLVAYYSLFPIWDFGFMDFRIGGETRIFHPVFAPISLPTHNIAEFITMLYDRIQQALQSGFSKDRAAKTPAPPAAWPKGQGWNLAQKKLERSAHALEVVRARQASLDRLKPRRAAGVDGQTLSKDSAHAAGQEVSIQTDAAERYLREAKVRIEARERRIHDLANQTKAGEPVGMLTLRKALGDLEREVQAFEFADVRLSTILPTERSKSVRNRAPSEAPLARAAASSLA